MKVRFEQWNANGFVCEGQMEVKDIPKTLLEFERKVEMLEAQVEELSRKIEAQENKKIRIGKIVSLTAEILTIIAGIVAIVELFM